MENENSVNELRRSFGLALFLLFLDAVKKYADVTKERAQLLEAHKEIDDD